MVSLFELSIDPCTGPGGYYTPGSVLSGILNVKVNSPAIVSCIQINFKGEEYCHWTESHTDSDGNSSTSHYTGKEEYFNVQVTVWTNQNAPDHLLPIGTHNFPYRFTFPTNRALPPSYEWTRSQYLGEAYIRYTIDAGISSGKQHYDFTSMARLPYLELVPVDSALLSSPVNIEYRKTVGLLCCASGDVDFTLDLPKTGFCVGDSIPIAVSVVNSCTKEVRMSASIVQQIRFISRGGHSRYHENTIGQVYDVQPIEPRSTRTWNTDALVINPLLTASLLSASVIKITYLLEVNGSIRYSLGSKQHIPIVIGNLRQGVPVNPVPQPGVPSTASFTPGPTTGAPTSAPQPSGPAPVIYAPHSGVSTRTVSGPQSSCSLQ